MKINTDELQKLLDMDEDKVQAYFMGNVISMLNRIVGLLLLLIISVNLITVLVLASEVNKAVGAVGSASFLILMLTIFYFLFSPRGEQNE